MRTVDMWARLAQQDGIVKDTLARAVRARELHEAMRQTCLSMAERKPQHGTPLGYQYSQALDELENFRRKYNKAMVALNTLHQRFMNVLEEV